MSGPEYPRTEKPLTFIDLFAGIGGMRIAFQNAGCRCVFSSEVDENARLVYQMNFGEEPEGDITKISASDMPRHDILVAGFPCQPFSIAGISKKRSLKQPVGFRDLSQGTLFFEIARILEAKKPRAFLLENVKHLKNHDKGQTFRIIERVLREELGYDMHYKVIDASNVVPQHRERIYIVGFRDGHDFEFPAIKHEGPRIRDILDKKVPRKYILNDKLWNYLQEYARRHRARGNGFGYGLVDLNGISRTLSARYYKDGSEILIPRRGANPRRLTPTECARLMGFPPKFKIHPSDSRAYRQFGNSVVVPVVEKIAESIIDCLQASRKRVTLVDYAV